jgi:hypothetical protein
MGNLNNLNNNAKNLLKALYKLRSEYANEKSFLGEYPFLKDPVVVYNFLKNL